MSATIQDYANQARLQKKNIENLKAVIEEKNKTIELKDKLIHSQAKTIGLLQLVKNDFKTKIN